MSYEVTLLVFGILLFLVGLVGKVKAKELEVGTSSKMARIILAIAGLVLVVLSFNPDIVKTVISPPQEQTGADTHTDQKNLDEKAEQARLAEEENRKAEQARLAEVERRKAEQARLAEERRRRIQLHGVYTIQQKSNRRYVDAHQDANDNSVVTRNWQNNDTQRWILTPLGNNTYTIQQKSNRQYVDAHQDANDNSVVTRNRQNNDTQRWIIKPL